MFLKHSQIAPSLASQLLTAAEAAARLLEQARDRLSARIAG